MREETKVAAFEGGELHELASESSSREVVLALPLSRLLVKMVRVPTGEDAVVVATPILKALSPFPDDPLAVSCETVREGVDAKIVIAAALPESSADDIAEALDGKKLNVVRIDALAIGALRKIWGELNVEDGKRRLVILNSSDCRTLIVLDGDQPSSIRAVENEADLQRETWLSLLEAEDFSGPKELAETLERTVSLEDSMLGIRERVGEEGGLDALPDSWREVLEESRFKTKLKRNLLIAGGFWLLIMAVLFGVPFGYGLMTDHVKSLSKAHAKQYKAVADKKAKTELVRKYSDHARGALEIMKAVSDRLPAGVTLSDWRFTRDDGITIKGETDDKDEAYQLKDRLVEMDVFQVVDLGSVNYQGGRHKFEITCEYESAED